MRHSLGGSLSGHLRGRSDSKTGRNSQDEKSDVEGDDTTVVEPEQNNVLSHIISQLRPGADLSRITLPTFILEERSMLERITNFMAHPETLLPMPDVDDPLQRFVAVTKFYLSGWHIKPPGVKKPLNPILGEVYTCYWEYPDNTRGYYISEQTSHHPPKSSYFFMAPEHNIRVDGTLKPRSKFLGNSAASLMEGISYLRFLNRGNRPGGEKYIITQPNMYARGILFGKMKYELGDHAYVKCPDTGFSADIEFKTKGWMGGVYNAVGGTIKNDKTNESLFELSGLWSGEMFIKDLRSGQKRPLFDASHAKHTPPVTRPVAEQGERESQRLWLSTVKAVHVMDHTTATDEKSKIEDRQREEAKKREETGEEWMPKLFRRVNAGPGGNEEGEENLEWIINAEINTSDPRKATEQILAIAPILPKGDDQRNQSTPINERVRSDKNSIPPPSKTSGSDNLIDLDSRPSSTAPPENAPKGKPLSSFQPPAAPSANAANLMDDDHGDSVGGLSQGVTNMSVHRPMKPLKRTDTDTGDTETFVDAEG